MSTAVANLLTEAMMLPPDARIDLVEAMLERSSPSEEFVSRQVEIVNQRIENVRTGVSALIPADEAHESVLGSLRLRS